MIDLVCCSSVEGSRASARNSRIVVSAVHSKPLRQRIGVGYEVVSVSKQSCEEAAALDDLLDRLETQYAEADEDETVDDVISNLTQIASFPVSLTFSNPYVPVA